MVTTQNLAVQVHLSTCHSRDPTSPTTWVLCRVSLGSDWALFSLWAMHIFSNPIRCLPQRFQSCKSITFMFPISVLLFDIKSNELSKMKRCTSYACPCCLWLLPKILQCQYASVSSRWSQPTWILKDGVDNPTANSRAWQRAKHQQSTQKHPDTQTHQLQNPHLPPQNVPTAQKLFRDQPA